LFSELERLQCVKYQRTFNIHLGYIVEMEDCIEYQVKTFIMMINRWAR